MWNPEAFFGARRYQFQVSEGEATADSMIPGNWLENPSDSRQESYVKAENVYHSFVLDSYTDISDELKERILAEFFAEDQDPEEMDFDELTTQIRQALRNHIRYTDIPQDMPENEDMVKLDSGWSERGKRRCLCYGSSYGLQGSRVSGQIHRGLSLV